MTILPPQYAWLLNELGLRFVGALSSVAVVTRMLSNRPFRTPPRVKSGVYGILANPGNFFGLCNSNHFAINRNKYIGALVAILELARHPLAILLAVWSVIVDAVYCVAFRAIAHVAEKSLKGIAPFLADGNPSASVVWIVRALRLVASAAHISPKPVFGCSVHAMSAVDHAASCARSFPRQTPATSRLAGAQVVSLNPSLGPTVALAECDPRSGFDNSPAFVFHTQTLQHGTFFCKENIHENG